MFQSHASSQLRVKVALRLSQVPRVPWSHPSSAAVPSDRSPRMVCLPVSIGAVLTARDCSTSRVHWKCPISWGNVKSVRKLLASAWRTGFGAAWSRWNSERQLVSKARSGSMDARRVFLHIASGDWEENEASASCGFCARCCKLCQHFLPRMSRKALGKSSEGQSAINCLLGCNLNGYVWPLAQSWHVKQTSVKSCKNKKQFALFFSFLSCCDLYILLFQPWQMQDIFVLSFSVCGCDICCIRHWAPVTHSFSNALSSFSK